MTETAKDNLRKVQERNHPKKGDVITVHPIRDIKNINKLKKLLRSNPRNYAIFTIGINTNLRSCDLVKLKVRDVKYLKAGDAFMLREKKTLKLRTITANESVVEAAQHLLDSMPNAKDGDFLFQSRKGGGAMSENSLNRLVKEWCGWLSIRENVGSHSLRKTFGYQLRVRHKIDIPTLMTMFNHSSQEETLKYLCIQADEVKNAYLKACL